MLISGTRAAWIGHFAYCDCLHFIAYVALLIYTDEKHSSQTGIIDVWWHISWTLSIFKTWAGSYSGNIQKTKCY